MAQTVVFSDDFSSNVVDASKYTAATPVFEGGIGNIHAQAGNGVMRFVGTTTQRWWSGGTLKIKETFSATADTPVTISIDRVAESGQGSASRSALWIFDETETKYVLFADVRGEGGWRFNRKIGQAGDNATSSGQNMAAFDGAAFDDSGLHKMSLVADGTTVKLLLDDVQGASVSFPFKNVIFHFGSLARNTNDTADTTWDNLKVQTIVRQTNTNPTITSIPDQTVFGGGAIGPLPFTISDLQTSASLLSVVATSSNEQVISNRDLLISGSGANRSLLIADVRQSSVDTTVTVTVRDHTGGIGTSNFMVTSFSGKTVIVDNLDAGFSSIGTWKESSTIDEFRGSSLIANDGKAVFTPSGLSAGEYEVLVWWAASLGGQNKAFRAAAVNYDILAGLNRNTIRLDQRTQSGRWVSLGSFTFDGLGGESVEVSAPANVSNGSFISADAVAFVAGAGTVDGSDVIVDNRDAGFSTTGSWDESGTISEFAGSSAATFSSEATATWRPNIGTAGSFEVYVWIGRETIHGGDIQRASEVQYQIFHGGIISRVTLNQNASTSGAWTLLGSYDFAGTSDERVTLLSTGAGQGSGSAVADAVWFARRDESNTSDLVYDNLDAGFSATGPWSESSAVDEFRGSSLFSMAPGALAMWEFGAIEPGRYQAFIWNSAALAGNNRIIRNSSARYVVLSGSGSFLVVINQNLNSGEWVSIGDFQFKGDGTEGISVTGGGLSTVADAVRLVKVE